MLGKENLRITSLNETNIFISKYNLIKKYNFN